MNCDECLKRMNSINWYNPKLDIYCEFKNVVREYNNKQSQNILWGILLRLYPPSTIEAFLIGRIERFGIGEAARLLKYIHPENPGTLFKLSADDCFIEATEFDLRNVWLEITDKLLEDKAKQTKIPDLIITNDDTKEKNENEWIEEDDDFLSTENNK